METQLIQTLQDFEKWRDAPGHPNGRNALAELKQARPPVAYPAMVIWSWTSDAISSRDWISYTYVYPNEFTDRILLNDKPTT
jgi:hypothetical protein